VCDVCELRLLAVLRRGGIGAPPGAWAQIAFLACYWALFTAAAFVTDRITMQPASRTSFVTTNNAAFFGLAAHACAVSGEGRFWIFAPAFGAVLAALSRLAAWRDPEDRSLEGAYLAQGLALTTTGLASHLTGRQLALTLAAQGTVLLSCGRARQARLLEIGGMLSTAGSFSLALAGIFCGGRHAVATAGIVTLVLLANAWWFKCQRDIAPSRLHPVASSLAIAGFFLGFLWMENLHLPHVAPWLAVAALGLAFLPFAELALFSQALLPAAVGKWIHPLAHGGSLLRPDTAIILASGIALAHWWSRSPGFDAALRRVAEGAASLSSVLIAMIWLRWEFTGMDVTPAAAIAGLVWTGATVFTGARLLSFAGLAFSIATVLDFTVWQSGSHWAVALLPILHVGIVARLVGKRAGARVGGPLAAIMLLFWSWEHIPAPWLALFYATASVATGVAGAGARNAAPSWISVALGVQATAVFWLHLILPPGASAAWRDLAALVILAAGCRFSRKLWPGGPLLQIAPIVAWSTMTGLAAWVARHNALASLTAAWPFLALGFFTAGFALRDRHYRFGGLALLGISVGRVFFVDVWGFEPIYRIISFIVLGIVLLVVGYGYNRFEERLRRWL